MRHLPTRFSPEGWTVTLNGEERRLAGWAYPVVAVLALPAGALILLALVLAVAAAMLVIPACAFGWLVSGPRP